MHSFKYMLEFSLLLFLHVIKRENKHECYSFALLPSLSVPVCGNVTEFP